MEKKNWKLWLYGSKSHRKWRETIIKGRSREERTERSPFAFISNNSPSLVYFTLYTEAAISPSRNKAPKYHCQHMAQAFTELCVCVRVCVVASQAVGSEEFSMNNWTWGEKPAIQKAKCQLPDSFYFRKRGIQRWDKEMNKRPNKQNKRRYQKPRKKHVQTCKA